MICSGLTLCKGRGPRTGVPLNHVSILASGLDGSKQDRNMKLICGLMLASERPNCYWKVYKLYS